MIFRALLSLVVVMTLASCNGAFHKEWKAALTRPVKPGNIAGAWEGTWRSEFNGHTGRLRCVVPEGTKSKPEFHYHATWAKVFSGSMKAVHHLRQQPNGVSFRAQHNLGTYGDFIADGTITDQKFSARYQAAGDQGMFEMQRLK